MPGRTRLPGGGEPRKASQRGLRCAPLPTRVEPIWQPGQPVRWKDRAGIFRRNVGDGEHSEILLGERIYRVRTRELG